MEIFDYDNILLLPRKCRVESRSGATPAWSWRTALPPAGGAGQHETVVDEAICTWMAQNGYFT